ncbi:TPA: single-stranded DNA-binding protein [Clostridioides difficile]|nr:single-stranded DNA-binding protein [Clostridioides difficile]
MNDVNLIGRLTSSPELKCKTNGKYVLYFNLAVDSLKSTDFIPIEVHGTLVEKYSIELEKGQKIALSGKINSKNYGDNKDKRYFSVSTAYIEYLTSKRVENKSNDNELKYTPEPIGEDDEIPF